MKMMVRLEEVHKGDRINGKKVVEVVHRSWCKYVRLVLEGGRDIIDGYYTTPKYIEVERE
jgi:hypothetical protein